MSDGNDGNTATEIEERLIDFAVRVIKVADALPKTPVGKHIAGQLLRLGTSLGRDRIRGAARDLRPLVASHCLPLLNLKQCNFLRLPQRKGAFLIMASPNGESNSHKMKAPVN